MDFDRTALRHWITVAPFDIGTFDAFVRTDSGTVEHYWRDADGVLFGPETIAGGFTSEPIATWASSGSSTALHLIGRNGGGLVDWQWDGAPGLAPLGPPVKVDLPGWCLHDPVVVRDDDGSLQVFAARLDGTVRRWQLTADGWSTPEPVAGASGDFTAVRRGPGVLDLFSADGGDELVHWINENGAWRRETRPATGSLGRPTAAAYEPTRLDVFAPRSDGVPVHWGWNGTRWFDQELVLNLVGPGGTPVAVTDSLRLVSFGVDRLMLFGLSTTGDLLRWILQPPRWSGLSDMRSDVRSFAAWSLIDDQVEVLTRQRDGTFVQWIFHNNPAQGMGEPVAGAWIDTTLVPTEPEPPPGPPLPSPVAPDVLLVRPSDLVLLGARWSDLDLQAGPPPELVARAGAELTLVFPPQHVGEEVVPAGGPAVPGLPLEQTGGIPTWGAALAGTSQVVVSLQAGTRVPLTVDGLLDAARSGHLVPGTGVGDPKTVLEIPYGLLFSPHTEDGSPIEVSHPAGVALGNAGAGGLWQTTIATGTPGALVLRALTARPTDPFALPLERGDRGRIVREAPTARIDRLSLSALGGSLQAAGAWEGFSWEHTAALGRDRRVRVATEGVLYPFGHRAEFVEVTERVFASGVDGAVAHLRKATTLRVIEPVRRDGGHEAFPFDEVEIERTAYEGVAAEWKTKDFPTPEAEQLEQAAAQADFEATKMRNRLLGDMDDGSTRLEALAEGTDPTAGDLLDPEDPESGTRQSAAEACLGMMLFRDSFLEKIAALADAAAVVVNVFFVPRPGADAPALRFPVRLGGLLGDVHVLVPVVFVADIRLPGGLLQDPWSSLDDGGVLERVAAYREAGDGGTDAGDVDAGGARIDLVRASEPKDGDVHEVRRLHLAGEPRAGGFRPRLGAAVLDAEQGAPAAERWAFETVLPSVRALLGQEQPLRFAYSRPFLDGDAATDVPFRIPDGAAKLATDFAKDSSRSGGILAPDIVADGLSRTYGPVSADALLDAAGGVLDPKRILAEGATLLGYSLADLIDRPALRDPPAILHHLSDAGTPVVTLTWPRITPPTDPGTPVVPPTPTGIPLATASGSFVTNPASRLTLTVTIGAAGQEVTCTLDQIALALPRPQPRDQAHRGRHREDRVHSAQRRGAGPAAARRHRRVLRAAEAAEGPAEGGRPRRRRPADHRLLERHRGVVRAAGAGRRHRRLPAHRSGLPRRPRRPVRRAPGDAVSGLRQPREAVPAQRAGLRRGRVRRPRDRQGGSAAPRAGARVRGVGRRRLRRRPRRGARARRDPDDQGRRPVRAHRLPPVRRQPQRAGTGHGERRDPRRADLRRPDQRDGRPGDAGAGDRPDAVQRLRRDRQRPVGDRRR
ncbi:hypothetical protein [Cumulibacter manganitolerans]|uniref:hypothetical protein n=1 Tax=Cumulibacter manganitolerans TaxID=1884992 RepID=UPI0012980077|nr:hypothetical protein [Cumulibacter manganitolerans]